MPEKSSHKTGLVATGISANGCRFVTKSYLCLYLFHPVVSGIRTHDHALKVWKLANVSHMNFLLLRYFASIIVNSKLFKTIPKIIIGLILRSLF